MTQSTKPETAAFDMMAALAAMPMPVVPTPGSFMSATVSHVSAKNGAFLDYGGKGMGLIQAKELSAEGLDLKPGDKLTVQVVSITDEDEVTLCSVRTTRPWMELDKAKTDHTTVKVWVDQVALNSAKDFAGLRVKYRGLRGFIPRSKLGFGLNRAEQVVKSELEVHVQDVVLGGDITFTHKEIHEVVRAAEEQTRQETRTRQREERAVKRDAFLADVPLHSEHDAKVVGIGCKSGNEYGVFAEIAPGVSGLIAQREVLGAKGKLSASFKVGDTLRVGVLNISDGRDGHKLLDLSMRIPVMTSIPENVELAGTVTLVAGYGVFVSLTDFNGIEGLVPAEMLSRAVNAGGKKLAKGSPVRVKVVRRDVAQTRLTLSMKGVNQPDANAKA